MAKNVPMEGLTRMRMAVLRSVLVGDGLYEPFTTDFLEGCSPDDVRDIMGFLNPQSMHDFSGRVPCGILVASGAAGTGKSFFLARLITPRVKAKDKVLVCCGQHGAVDNALNKVQSSLKALDVVALVVRCTHQDGDMDAARRLIFSDTGIPGERTSKSPYKKSLSPFEWVMKVLGEMESEGDAAVIGRLSQLPDLVAVVSLLQQWWACKQQQTAQMTVQQQVDFQTEGERLLSELKHSFAQAFQTVIRMADVVGAMSYGPYGTLNGSPKLFFVLHVPCAPHPTPTYLRFLPN